MHVIRPDHAALARAVRWTVLVAATLIALAVVLSVVITAPARAEPGRPADQTGPDQALAAAQRTGTATGYYVAPDGKRSWVGVFGTHRASASYGYPYPAAPDCDESAVSSAGCVGDARGFYQGQCTSWVAQRLGVRNGIAFSNWYAGRHWGDAADWAKVAKSLGHKPDRTPAVGAVGWYKRGHVAYVEEVYDSGSVLLSQMNTDGHNGFSVSVVSPGGPGWPDKFLHLADVLPVDLDPPTPPGDLRVAAHTGRTGLRWSEATDESGEVAYRVARNGVTIATTPETSFWDTTAPAGQTAVYTVVAYDPAGHDSTPARARVVPGEESADRAWLPTSAGPALCGRTGSARSPGLACRILGASGWREVALWQQADWGRAGTRAFVGRIGGGADGLAFCSAAGRGRAVLTCAMVDAQARTWGTPRASERTPVLAALDSTWVGTAVGPARCGRSGTAADPRVACSVLTRWGWRSVETSGPTDWGTADTRAFLRTAEGDVAYCRSLLVGGQARLACRVLGVRSLTWGGDFRSGNVPDALPDDATWVASSAGPAYCSSTAGRRPGGCRVLSGIGWQAAPLPRRADLGAPDSRVFLADREGHVSWCRVTARGRQVACAALDPEEGAWETGRSTRLAAALRSGPRLTANHTWLVTGAGPALCGRTGTARQERLGCQVLTHAGWRYSGSHQVSWGGTGYRAFLPSGAGAAYCRTVAAAQGSALSCTRLSQLEWGVDHTSGRVALPLADAF